MMAAVVAAIEAGDFTRDAFAAQGVGWSTAHGWLRLGEASAKLAAEPGTTHSLTWQGQLYLDVKKAEAFAVAAPMRKLRTQAADLGGDLAVKFVKLRRGKSGGNGSGGPAAGFGTDYVEQEAASGQDQMTDDDVMKLIEESIAAAEAAARVLADENPE